MRKALIILCFLAAGIISILPVQAGGKGADVYIIPVHKEVERGLSAYLERAIKSAEEHHAEAVIFDINTNGGLVDAASEIGELIANADLKTISYINPKALSAGAFIALHTDDIYMNPRATMGSAAIIDQSGNTAGEKAESMWLAAMSAAAKDKGRDPQVAQAMVSKKVDLPELKQNGKLLTLTPDQALKVGYSKGTIKNMDDLLAELGYDQARVHNVEPTLAEKIARFVTNPVIVPILLTIGSLGLVVELYSPGFGLPGTMGIAALLLFFYGHYIAGFAEYESLVLFILGVLLIAAEFFLPGGIAGILGGVSLIGSILMAGENATYMAASIIVALFAAVVVMIIMVKVFGRRMNIFKKLILTDSTNTESGYVSNVNRLELLGREGITVTPLRPAGAVQVEEERLDVVAEGSYIAKGITVKIVKVEGSRIVVRPIH